MRGFYFLICNQLFFFFLCLFLFFSRLSRLPIISQVFFFLDGGSQKGIGGSVALFLALAFSDGVL